jgi:hypothetical protein
MARKSWEDLYDEGRVFVYSSENDHDGEVTVSVHLAPDTKDPPDVNDPEIISWYPANEMWQDGFFKGSIGSSNLDYSVVRYMDDMKIKRPRAKRVRINRDGIVPSDFSHTRTMMTAERWR